MRKVTGRVGVGIALAMLGGFLAGGPTLAYAEGTRITDGPAVEVPLRSASDSDWGTVSAVDYVVPAWEMQALDGSVQNRAGFTYGRYSPSGAEIEAPLHLPSGALIQKIELQGCDSSSTNELVYVLFRVDSSGTAQALSTVATTGTTATPGCGFFQLTLGAPHQVDNYLYAYYVAVRGPSSDASYSAVRVYYNLQVSPAPSTARFPNDVPTTHPFFRYVEALAASGITGGCGAGTFCPDSPVTRGQMAVFLAAALGLHFPN
jgi:hypothetical protein